MIAIRITLFDNNTYGKYVATIMKKCTKFFVVYEEGKEGCKHIQGYIEVMVKPNIKDKSMIDSFRKYLKEEHKELVGNKYMSLKKCNEDYKKYIQYLCKGEKKNEKVHVLCNNILDSKDIDELHIKYWEQNEKLKKERKSMSKIDAIASIEIDEMLKGTERELFYLKCILYHKEKKILQPNNFMLDRLYQTYKISLIEDQNGILKYIKLNYLM